MKRRLIPAALLCALVTGCGSTVQLGASGAPVDQSGLQTGTLSTTGPTAGAVAPTDAGPTAGSSTAPLPGSSDEPGVDGSVPVGGGETSGAPGGGPVVNYDAPATGSPVEVGIMYIPDLGAAGAQFGGSGEDQTDQQGYMKAAVDYMNNHGGLGGHKINLLFYGAQIAGTKSYADSEQEMCAMMTQDHHVVASVIANITVDNLMAECMQKAKGLYVTDGGYMKTAADWQRLSYTVSPTEMNSDVLGRQLAQYIVDKKAAKKGDAVGVVAYDAPGFHEALTQFTAVAKANGLNVVSSEVHYATSTPDLANTITQVQSAELAMKARGAKVVVSLCSGGCIGYFFKNAESQKYYPRYVFSSIDGVVNAPSAATGNQLRDALGTMPTQDVDLYKHPQLFSDPTYNTCRAINKANHSVNNVVNLGISQRVCAALMLIQTAAKGFGGTNITGTTLRDGLGRIGTSITSGTALRSSFSATKHYAPAAYRSLHYDYNKGEFVYDSGPIALH